MHLTVISPKKLKSTILSSLNKYHALAYNIPKHHNIIQNIIVILDKNEDPDFPFGYVEIRNTAKLKMYWLCIYKYIYLYVGRR